MRITYASDADAMMIYLRDERVKAAHSREIIPARLIIRFDENNNPISFELLDVSQYVDDPTHATVIDLVQQAIAAGDRAK
jgi:uncharacterized protein YuzE